MAPEPNKPRPVRVEDLKGLLEQEYPVDLAEIKSLLDTVAGRLDSVYGKIAGPLPDGCSEDDREWRKANRVSQVAHALHILTSEAVERHRAK